MIGMFQPWHVIVTLVIVLMVFGPGKLPQLGRAVGDGLRELKRASDEHSASALRLEPPTEQVRSITSSALCRSCAAALPPAQPFCGVCGATQAIAATSVA